jgi:hypothetical protein
MSKQTVTQTVGELLQERARSRLEPEPTITYGELAKRLGLPAFKGPDWQNHPLSGILGELNNEDHAANRPFRSVLVINAKDNISGASFFWAVSQLRYGGVEIPGNCRTAYWYLERDMLLAYWRRQNPT